MDEKLSPDDIVNMTDLQRKLKETGLKDVNLSASTVEKSEDAFDSKASAILTATGADEDTANYYTCKICMQIVYNPQMCK